MVTVFGTLWEANSSQFHDIFGQTVTYSRGAVSIELNAIEIQEEEMITGEPVLLTSHARTNWLIKGSDIEDIFPPRRGDKITTAEGIVYEAQERGDGLNIYTRDDPDGVWIRLHTTRIAGDNS